MVREGCRERRQARESFARSPEIGESVADDRHLATMPRVKNTAAGSWSIDGVYRDRRRVPGTGRHARPGACRQCEAPGPDHSRVGYAGHGRLQQSWQLAEAGKDVQSVVFSPDQRSVLAQQMASSTEFVAKPPELWEVSQRPSRSQTRIVGGRDLQQPGVRARWRDHYGHRLFAGSARLEHPERSDDLENTQQTPNFPSFPQVARGSFRRCAKDRLSQYLIPRRVPHS